MDTERLQAFRAVAREHSFSRAAERLGKSQPAISQAVRALEDDLGMRLFDRHGRRVTLSEAGRALLPHADATFDAIDAGRAAVAAAAELRTGELRLAASDTVVCYELPAALRRFRSAYPGVELRLVNRPSPRAAELVADGEVHLAIVTLDVAPSGVTLEPLAAREDVAVFAPAHPLAGRARVSLGALARQPLVLLDRGAATRRVIDAAFARAGLAPDIALEVGSIETLKRLVELGFGVSIAPRVAIERELVDGRLASARVFLKRDQRRLAIARPARGTSGPAAAIFADLVRETLPGSRPR